MTRFARAKGSKASNERHPEEATPWHVMKQEIEIATTLKKDNIKCKTKSAKELLSEKDDLFYTTTTGNVNTDWAEFETEHEEHSKKKKIEHSNDTMKEEKNKKKEKKQLVNSTDEKKENFDNSVTENGEGLETPQKNSRKRQSTENISIEKFDDKPNETAVVDESNLVSKKKKKIVSLEETNTKNQDVSNVEIKDADNIKEKIEGATVKLSKRQKRNRKNKIKTANEAEVAENEKTENRNTSGAFNTNGNEWNSDIKFGNSKKVEINTIQDQNKFDNRNTNNSYGNNFNNYDNKFGNKMNGKKRKPPKIRDDKEHKRRKPTPGTSKVIINGLEVEIVMFDGFPIKKDDAERLKDLRQQMVMKGIPKSEIDAAMKLERRKAEKALTRIKKHVCFHCRLAGHNLSDCPDLNKEESTTGICFKCGSTEHTHFECKVNKKEEFRFASCFICRERGHIAKQCPDNPKGLYPDGGSCNVCGDVTHLKKDCPELTAVKDDNVLTLGTIAKSTLESLDDNTVEKSNNNLQKTQSKIVKF